MAPDDSFTAARAAAAADAADPLAAHRDEFVAPAGIYLDGNSLGPPLRATRAEVDRVLAQWEGAGVEAWPDWFARLRATADALAALLGVPADALVLSDSTSVNLFKLVEAAVEAAVDAAAGRRVLVVDPQEFPTNRYVVDGIAARRGLEVRALPADVDEGIDPAALAEVIRPDVAAVVVSGVNYRSGALAPVDALRAAARSAGTTLVWDLCHSAGAVPVPPGLGHDGGPDLAVGCTYKHLGGGPGAPGFLVVPRDRHAGLHPPIQGWFGHRDQFGMRERYEADASITRFLVGTPPVLSAAPLAASLELLGRVGVERLRARSVALVGTARTAVTDLLAGHGFRLASPADPARTGAHLTVEHPDAWPICRAARAAGVVVDHREPHRIRIGPSPLFTRHAEVVEGVRRIAEVVRTGAHERYPAEPDGQVT